jgi:hypothetical protein
MAPTFLKSDLVLMFGRANVWSISTGGNKAGNPGQRRRLKSQFHGIELI